MAYLGMQPNDVKVNTGLYSPSEILQLTKDGSWGGSLQLIAENNITSTTASVDFTGLANTPYDVYLLTVDNYLMIMVLRLLLLIISIQDKEII